jgi:inosose dehydratase
MRLAGAPISWGVCEVPGWGLQLEPRRVLEEMRSLGLRATEAGPDGFLPEDPGELRAMLAAVGLSLVGGFVPLALHRDDGWRDDLRRAAHRLAAGGAEVLVLAATADAGYEGRSRLRPGEWQRLLGALDEVQSVAAEAGMAAVLHPHLGTLVERPEEVERVLAGSEIQLCLDTGHLAAAGVDPAALVARVPERIGHVHLKDVSVEVAGRLRSGRIGYREAVGQGLWVPLGEGGARLGEVVAALEMAGYRGWYVLEQDVALADEPRAGTGPREAVARSLGWLRREGAPLQLP